MANSRNDTLNDTVNDIPNDTANDKANGTTSNAAERICYVNGQFVSESNANISIFDRGFLFADSVYEVNLVLHKALIDSQGHLTRLAYSLNEVGIPMPMPQDELMAIQRAIIEKNQLVHGAIYLQVTRGQDADRDFLPSKTIQPNVVIIPQPKNLLENPLADSGIRVMAFPEIRWTKRNIKSTGLLGAVLAKQAAVDNGFDDAWFIEAGLVTEGSANNAFIIKGNRLITKAPNAQILNGITRRAILTMATTHGLTLEERDFSLDEAKSADEAFVTSATMLVIPVIQIDETIIGDGKPGALTKQMRQIYLDTALNHQLP